MKGGEDGVRDTGDVGGALTTPEEAMEFVTLALISWHRLSRMRMGIVEVYRIRS